MGVDPAANITAMATKNGIETMALFYQKLLKNSREKGKHQS
jgi:hypothetical protein